MTTGTQAATDRVSDLQRVTLGQEQINNIPNNAIQIFGTGGAVATLPLAQFLDTQNVQVMGRIKSIFVLAGATVPTKGAASQATLTLYAGLQTFAGGNGGASQLPHAGTAADQATYGAAFNLGANAATLPAGFYIITPADIAGLQWALPWVGVEINWGGAITSGQAAVFLVVDPI